MTKTTFTAKQQRYIEILADPDDSRKQEDVAKSLRVTRKTLYEWRKLEGFWEAVGELVKDGTDQRMGRVWSKLVSLCERGNVPAMKLLFQLRGELVEKSEQKHELEGGAPTVVFDLRDGEGK